LIGRLTGRLAGKHPPQVLVDVGGVGYEVDVPMSTFYSLPAAGEPERTAFRQLIRISGVGARTALSVLSGLSVGDLAQAVALQDAQTLTKVPGIGKKTAERLLLELKGKLADAKPGEPGAAGSSDILNALLGLGYSEKEALAAVKGLPAGVGVAEGIRAALKTLAKS
jgi:Holliday junction DNA helicase RuvA